MKKSCGLLVCAWLAVAAAGQDLAGYEWGEPKALAWGFNLTQQAVIPDTVTNVIALAGGVYHSIALQADGRVAAWGWNKYGQTDVPSDLTNVALIAATEYHNLALRRPSEPTAETAQAAPSDAAARTTREPAALWRWGRNDGVSTGHAAQPTGGTTGEAAVEILAIAPAAGTALQSDRPGLEITWRSRAGHIYCVQVTDDLGQAAWQTIQAGIPATPPQNAFTLATDERLRFYRIGEKLAE